MPDPRFQEQVIYMCAHSDEEGAMGLTINRPTEFTLADILRSTDIPVPEANLPPVYVGGPVEMDAAFILYAAESDTVPDNALWVKDSIYLSRDPQLLKDISVGTGPKDYIFLLGYAGWAPGQLEGELSVNGWITLPADYEDLFLTPSENKWKHVTNKYGIDIELFGDVIGTA
ncbi:YqgE/AlgH family protein [Thermodesulfobacteriota bacterium]